MFAVGLGGLPSRAVGRDQGNAAERKLAAGEVEAQVADVRVAAGVDDHVGPRLAQSTDRSAYVSSDPSAATPDRRTTLVATRSSKNRSCDEKITAPA